LDENTTPLEAGLGFFVALDKGDFIGHTVLAAQRAKGIAKKSVAFTMRGKSAPPRPQYAIWVNGTRAGEVTSGTQSPSLGIGIGMGYVPAPLAGFGTAIEIEIRGKRAPAEVVARPVYKRP
jgi:aminomethyltransferase